jgi:hypothetical protein
MYFLPSPDYFSKNKNLDYDIRCHFDEWAYFPKHDLTSFSPKSYFTSQAEALSFAKSFDFSSLIMSDTVFGDYGGVMSPTRNEPLQFFISHVTQSEVDPLQYALSGVMKDRDNVIPFTGEQFIKVARFEYGEQGALIVHGPFILQTKPKGSSAKVLSGLWTHHIKRLKHVPAIDREELRASHMENIFKTYGGVMTSVDFKGKELTKWGNATAVGNFYSTPTNKSWWNVQQTVRHSKADWLEQFDFDGDGLNDQVLFHYSGGAHCCYTLEVILTSNKKSVKYPFQMDGGYVGGVDDSRPDQLKIEDIDRDGLPEIVVQIETYNGKSHTIPKAWQKQYGITTNKVVIEYEDGQLHTRDFEKR